MEESAASTRRAGSLARTACLACRRLKVGRKGRVVFSAHCCLQMKCVGAGSPPCVRCSKVGRHCVVPTPTQHHHTSPNLNTAPKRPELERFPTTPALNIDPNHAITLPLLGSNVHCGPKSSPNQTSSRPSSPHSSIPKGRWLSALPTLCRLPILPAYNRVTLSRSHLHGRSDVAELPEWSHHGRDGILDAAHSLPSDEELCHLGRFFITNLMAHIPVLTELDVSDLVAIVKSKRLLAYSMAYVAARYMPGCRAIRTTLAPTIRAVVRLQFDHSESSDEQRWTLLQALTVLYSWAPLQHPETQNDAELDLQPEQVRASIETLALRYSLHSSAEELARLLKHDATDVRQTFAFRRYTYWLWLFSLGYFRSLISQTPPSIREDATITMAPQLLEVLIHDDCVRQILARVELCLLWADASVRARGLGEWWCAVSTQVGLDSRLAVLNDLDTALQLWRQKWIHPAASSWLEGTSKFGRDCSIDIYYYFTRFCISTYVIKLYQFSAPAESLLLSIVNLVTKSIERASGLCHFLLKLTPLAKASMGFSPEIIFAMIASSCEYLMHVYHSSVDLDLLQPSHISAIRGIADLMIDLGADDRHSGKIYGQSILARLPPQRPDALWPKSQRASSQKHGQMWSVNTASHGALSSPESGASIDGTWPARGIVNTHVTVSRAEPHGLAITTGAGNGSSQWQEYRGTPAFPTDSWWSPDLRSQTSHEYVGATGVDPEL